MKTTKFRLEKTAYTNSLLSTFGIQDCKPVGILVIDVGLKLKKALTMMIV